MLDKTLPYYNMIMKRPCGAPIPVCSLGEDFSFETYAVGDEKAWASIMADVGEFDDAEEALAYFQKEYCAFEDEIKRRMIFIKDKTGEMVGTLTIWWRYTEERRNPTLEWVAVRPEHQGLGLGRALIIEGMKRMIRIEDDRDFYLHTQTWSHKAVRLYLHVGYEIVKDEVFGGYENDYEKAMETIGHMLVLKEEKQ